MKKMFQVVGKSGKDFQRISTQDYKYGVLGVNLVTGREWLSTCHTTKELAQKQIKPCKNTNYIVKLVKLERIK